MHIDKQNIAHCAFTIYNVVIDFSLKYNYVKSIEGDVYFIKSMAYILHYFVFVSLSKKSNEFDFYSIIYFFQEF